MTATHGISAYSTGCRCTICRSGHAAYQRAWNKSHPARARATSKRTREKHDTPEDRARVATARRERRKGIPYWWREQSLKKRYGLTLEMFDALLAKQGGLCAMCHRALPAHDWTARAKISIDHDHRTGKVRGLVHQPCNMAIGFYEKYGELPCEYLARP